MAERIHTKRKTAVGPRAGGTMGVWGSAVCDALASIVFPADCRICEKLLTRAQRVPICADCLASFEQLQGSMCGMCGQLARWPGHVESAAVRCPACQNGTYAFDRARSYAIYHGALVNATLLLKFERIEPLGVWFAERLTEVVEREEDILGADVVISVPLHHEREKDRGYNQADLIAKPLARKLGLPHRAVLRRTRPRPEKHVLSLEERWLSVRGAFSVQEGSQVDKKRVLLVDDVMTTGATLDACARALLDVGAKSVIGLTVARAIRN